MVVCKIKVENKGGRCNALKGIRKLLKSATVQMHGVPNLLIIFLKKYSILTFLRCIGGIIAWKSVFVFFNSHIKEAIYYMYLNQNNMIKKTIWMKLNFKFIKFLHFTYKL